ncbi:hypothetical protein CJF31_00008485 [Rutstroemia sp. NJR-2017a BVV2]|nr:hypothetical protein CJF31_00008485 [Rutstroemia sp. NJR-2017a BVV2]
MDKRAEGHSNTRYSTFGGGSIWWHPSIGARQFCARERKYNIAITTFDIHEVRSAFRDTLYIAACITSAATGVKSGAIPLGDHTSEFVYPDLKLLDCPVADDEIATLTYIVIHNSSNDQADIIKEEGGA